MENYNLLLTVILAIIVMGIVVVGLAIGLIFSGRSRLRRGCGLAPKRGQKKDMQDNKCSICGNKKSCEESDGNHIEHSN